MASASNSATVRQRTTSASDSLRGMASHSPGLSPSTPKLMPSPRLSPAKSHALSVPLPTHAVAPGVPTLFSSKSKEERNAEFLHNQLAVVKDELRGISEYESDESEMASLRLQNAELQTRLQAQCAEGQALRAITHAEQQGLRIRHLEIQLQEWMVKATRRSHDEELWEQRETRSAQLKVDCRVMAARIKKLEGKLHTLDATYAERQKQVQTLADTLVRLQADKKTLDAQIAQRKNELSAPVVANHGATVTPQDAPKRARVGSATATQKEKETLKKEIAALKARLAKPVVATPAPPAAEPLPPARPIRPPMWQLVGEHAQLHLIAMLLVQLFPVLIGELYSWAIGDAM